MTHPAFQLLEHLWIVVHENYQLPLYLELLLFADDDHYSVPLNYAT